MQSYALKFILVGDSGVGKSQLSRSFTKKPFKGDLPSTVGMEFATREIPFERCVIKAQIWDTAGMERFEAMSKAYYRDAVGALLVFDITNPSSFERLKTVWLKQLRDYGNEKMAVMMVANKVDKLSSCKPGEFVSTSEAVIFAESQGFDYAEVSALGSINVERAFRRLILSFAKLVPDVRVHLELTGLPDGWLRRPIQGESTLGASSGSSSSPESSPTDDVPQRLQLESLDGTEGMSPLQQRAAPIRIPGQAGGSPDSPPSNRFSSSFGSHQIGRAYNESNSSNRPYQSDAESPQRLSITTRPKMEYMYTNYWSGEETQDRPTSPAPAGLLYESDRSTLGSLILKDPNASLTPRQPGRPADRRNVDVEMIRESSPSADTINIRGNGKDAVAFSPLSSSSPRLASDRFGASSPGTNKINNSSNSNSNSNINGNGNGNRFPAPVAGKGKFGSGSGISMRSNKVVDSGDSPAQELGGGNQPLNQRCFCVIL